MKRLIALLVAGLLMFAMSLPVFAAEDTGAVTATVTAKFVAVQVTNTSVTYGTLDVATSKDTVTLGSPPHIAIVGSNVDVEIRVSSTDATGGNTWNLVNAGSLGAEDAYAHEYSTNTPGNWLDFPNDNNLTSSAIATLSADSGTEDLDLRITTPTTVSDGAGKIITILIQATSV